MRVAVQKNKPSRAASRSPTRRMKQSFVKKTALLMQVVQRLNRQQEELNFLKDYPSLPQDRQRWRSPPTEKSTKKLLRCISQPSTNVERWSIDGPIKAETDSEEATTDLATETNPKEEVGIMIRIRDGIITDPATTTCKSQKRSYSYIIPTVALK